MAKLKHTVPGYLLSNFTGKAIYELYE